MLLKHPAAVELDHRGFFLRGAPGQSLALAASENGRISSFGLASAAQVSLRRRDKIRGLGLHPTKQLIALTEGESGRLNVIDFDGSSMFREEGPGARQGSPRWLRAGFDDCFFDESGDYLWCAATRSRDEATVQLRESGRWSVVLSVEVQDPFGGSSCSFHRTGKPEVVALWLAAGQDGQQVYWLTRQAGEVRCDPEINLENTTPPAFSPSGTSFWVVNDDQAACRFEYPSVRQTASCESPCGEDDPFGCSVCCLDDRYAFVGSGSGRIFVLDARRMNVVEEVIIEGHEPRPVEHYYPSLVGDKQLSTDISFFQRVGSLIVFVHRLDRGSDLSGWKDGLLCFSVDALR